MTSAEVVETSVTNNSSFQNYPHPFWTKNETVKCYFGPKDLERIRLKTIFIRITTHSKLNLVVISAHCFVLGNRDS